MEYDIYSFTSKLKDYFVNSPLFPIYNEQFPIWDLRNFKKQSAVSKHPFRQPTHLKDKAIECFAKSTIIGDNTIVFELGNEEMERNYPHYHILEDTQIIRKRNKGTEKSKGTQDMIKNVSKRDYGYVYWNGKTFTKEYSRNVRGSRNRANSVSRWAVIDGKPKWVDAQSNSYLNVHYHYIENILNMDILDKLAFEFNLKRTRTLDSGLAEEYAEQQGTSIENILEIFGSFMQ